MVQERPPAHQLRSGNKLSAASPFYLWHVLVTSNIGATNGTLPSCSSGFAPLASVLAAGAYTCPGEARTYSWFGSADHWLDTAVWQCTFPTESENQWFTTCGRLGVDIRRKATCRRPTRNESTAFNPHSAQCLVDTMCCARDPSNPGAPNGMAQDMVNIPDAIRRRRKSGP